MRRHLAPLALALLALLAAPAARGQVRDKDSDGDGLSDFQETHKYFTDPSKSSTAGDGVKDGDWDRRREFTYTVRSVVAVLRPVNTATLNDDYQDARVLSRGRDTYRLEVVHYPLNTVAAGIRGDPDWRDRRGDFDDTLRPGVTTNWDFPMRRRLTASLRTAEIDPQDLDDRALAAGAARWLFAQSKSMPMFCTHFVHFPNNRPAILPGLEKAFAANKGRSSWSQQEQFDHELLGRGMFLNRTYGASTSAATYLATALRALGLPARMVLAIPIVDAGDPEQRALVRANLRHHRVRGTARLGLANAIGFAAHTYNEVFVGDRWVRLNRGRLGQNILDANVLGLMTHVHTFNDLADAQLAETWGVRLATGKRDSVFRTANPYRTEELSDHFGRFAKVDNPPFPEHTQITLDRAYWFDSPDTPRFILEGVTHDANDASGRVLAHGEEWFDDQDHRQYGAFVQEAGKTFRFRAPGRPDVTGIASGSYYAHPPEGAREFEIVIPPAEFAKMAPGVEYTITPANEAPGLAWKTKGRLAIKRP
jgi:hypothetical protein